MFRRSVSRILLAVADAAEWVESAALRLACRIDADPSAVGFARDDLYPPSCTAAEGVRMGEDFAAGFALLGSGAQALHPPRRVPWRVH